jgi:hypothetical protein
VLFKDLKAFVTKNIEQQQLKHEDVRLQQLRGLPFWEWDTELHKQICNDKVGAHCFNHKIGLPVKNNVEHQLYDYEKMVLDALFDDDAYNPLHHNFKYKHLWIKKSTGIGITELCLRLMAYLCLRDDAFKNSQMIVVTGPNISLAIKLIQRMKALFEPKLGVTFASKETVLELNGCTIEAFPSNHIDSFRSLTNPKFLLLDECDFFRKSEQTDVRHVAERYIAKSDPYIVMVSTPNAPGMLFESIEREPEETCLYKRLVLDYMFGLNKIYSLEEIEKAKASPGFEREYAGKYGGLIGNVFAQRDIDAAIEKGKAYNPDDWTPIHFTAKSLGIDPAFGSSKFAMVLTQWTDNHVQILHAEEYERPDFNEMMSVAYGLISKYNVDKVYIDGSNPAFIKSLKIRLGESTNYLEEIDLARKQGFGDGTSNMRIIPVNFNSEHRALLGHTKMLLEQNPRVVAINPKFDKLVVALRTAVAEDGVLDKEATAHDDLLDSFRMALKFYKFEGK